MATPSVKPRATNKPSATTYFGLVVGFILFALGGGYLAATTSGEWKTPFSWHPFLMTCGMVGTMGVSTVTKKLGGYTNTKLHAMMSWGGLFLSFGGLYAIYQNKNNTGRPHFTSPHSLFGIAMIISCVGLGLAGSIVLHPDFGIDKQNKTIRFAHKMGARGTLFLAWCSALSGLFYMTQDPVTLAMYAIPLVMFVPFTLL